MSFYSWLPRHNVMCLSVWNRRFSSSCFAPLFHSKTLPFFKRFVLDILYQIIHGRIISLYVISQVSTKLKSKWDNSSEMKRFGFSCNPYIKASFRPHSKMVGMLVLGWNIFPVWVKSAQNKYFNSILSVLSQTKVILFGLVNIFSGK